MEDIIREAESVIRNTERAEKKLAIIKTVEAVRAGVQKDERSES